jgi:RNA polymerase sigma-70 factor (ECF subfamily)
LLGTRRTESDFSQRIRQGVRQTTGLATAVRVGTARIGVPGIHPSAETLEGLVARHGNRVYQLAYRLTRSTADAEDVLQDVFLKLYRSWSHVAACENLDGLLTRVVTNACIDLLRSRRCRGSTAEPATLARLSAPSDCPSQAIEEREFDEKLKAALEELPPRQMAALILFDHEGLKAKEVGRILNLTEGAVRRYVFEGRRKVKDILAPYLRGDQS